MNFDDKYTKLILRSVVAAYLIYLAYGAFKSSGKMTLGSAGSRSSKLALYRRGLLMNVLNPKVLLFFLAFLPQFIDINQDSASLQIALLGLTFALQALAIFTLVSICAGKLRKIIINNQNLGRYFAILEGSVLTIIALALIVT